MNVKETIVQRFQDSIAVKNRVMNDDTVIDEVSKIADIVTDVLRSGNKLILCGNGGSASDALHFAGEIVGRFQRDRSAWPAITLNSDVTAMTAISNDYGFEEVFARQAEAHTRPGDLFIGISTSGNSENVYRAAIAAKEKGAKTAAFLGNNGGKIKEVVDHPLVVECDNTARVQECHICIIHIICELVEERMKRQEKGNGSK